MASNVVGLFDTYEHAHIAVGELLANGFPSTAISVVAPDERGTIRKEVVEESGDLASAGAVSGAASGLLVGGLIGLLVGATVLAVPPVGFVVAGPIAGLLAGAGVGLVSGGLLGALIGLGIPEEEAHYYAESVRRGGVLVTVQAIGTDALRAQQVLAAAGAVNITERAAALRAGGFTSYNPALPVYTADEVIAERARLGVSVPAVVASPATAPVVTHVHEASISPGLEAYQADFLNHFNTMYAHGTRPFANMEPAYRYGYEAAFHPDFHGLNWSAIEPQVRVMWERANPTTTWDAYRDAVEFGWSRGQAAGATASSGRAQLI